MPEQQYTVQEADVVASLCRESFYFFMQEFVGEVVQEPMVWNWHIKYLCDHLQRQCERIFARQPKEWDTIINIPPGTTKSTTCSVLLVPWAWTRMPEFRAIWGSHTDALALDLGRKARDVVQSEKYKAVFPEIVLRPDQNTKSYFANTKGGMRFAVGVGGSVIGMHGHMLGIDDPIDPESAASLSEDELKTVNRWCSETLPSRKVDKTVASTVLIMQRLHQNDPTGHLLGKGKRNIYHICIPAEPTPDVHPPELAAFYQGGTMDPIRLSNAVLEEAKVDLGEYGYAGQYLQHPVPRGGGMFKGWPPTVTQEPKQYTGVVRYWDKAGTSGGGAFTVGFKLGRYVSPVDKTPRYRILDVIRGQWDASKREALILATAKVDGRGVRVGVEQEPGSGGKESAEATARRLSGYRVKLDKVTGDKETRADEFAVAWNAGGVELAPGAWHQELQNEFGYFPYSRYKDQVDAGSGAFAMLAKARRIVGALGGGG